MKGKNVVLRNYEKGRSVHSNDRERRGQHLVLFNDHDEQASVIKAGFLTISAL